MCQSLAVSSHPNQHLFRAQCQNSLGMTIRSSYSKISWNLGTKLFFPFHPQWEIHFPQYVYTQIKIFMYHHMDVDLKGKFPVQMTCHFFAAQSCRMIGLYLKSEVQQEHFPLCRRVSSMQCRERKSYTISHNLKISYPLPIMIKKISPHLNSRRSRSHIRNSKFSILHFMQSSGMCFPSWCLNNMS